ncbi:protein PFC0760c-like isoform X2 [Planococcus citri]|uniref:protein PFC0760c-like isoform X2 n=1 Tax=Planococcus citri TaxID=170843 RepID=UPI0031F9F4BF
MVSESPFSEPTILSEQTTASNFLGSDKSFKTPIHSFMNMAQVGSLTQQSINDSEEIINSNRISNDIDDSEGINSDIELSIEESDDKETVSETEDATVSLKKKILLNKDTESLESLDSDLANAAHLAGTGFSADEFDQIDCLDTIDDSAYGSNGNTISKLVPHSTELDDRGKNCDSNKTCVNTSTDGDITQTNAANDENGERSGDEQLLNESPVKIERNNNKTERIVENEKPTGERGSKQLSRNTIVKFEPGIFLRNDPAEILAKQEAFEEEFSDEFRLEIDSCSDEQSQDSVSRQPLSLESNSKNIARSQNNDSRKVEELATQCEKISSKSTVPPEDGSKENETASVRIDEDSSKLTEKMSALVENNASKQIDEKSTSDVISMKNADKPDDNITSVLETVEPVQCEKSSSEAISIANSTSNIESNQIENMSIDDDTSLDDIPVANVRKSDDNRPGVIMKNTSEQYEDMSIDDTPSKIIRNEDINQSSETRSTSVIEDIPAAIRSSVAENQNLEFSEDEVSPQNDDIRSDCNLQEAQTVDSPDVILSPMIVDDDKDPKSVESNDIIIDSVESEIVELDADDEPVILDDDLSDASPSDSRTSQQKFNQPLENTAKEVTHDDIEAEVVAGNDDPVPSTSGIANDEYKKVEISLNRLTSNDTDSRKRRLQSNQDDSFSSDSLFVEKRARISEPNSSDRCNGTNSTEHRKKPLANRARKHTSSTNVDKTFEEIQKKIRDGLDKQNRNQDPSSGQDVFDEYDCEIHDNDGDTNDANFNETAQNADNDAHKIQLNYDVISKENLKNIFKVMRTKLTRKQLETMMIQKCCEMISDSNEIGTLRRQVADLQQAEMFRKQKIMNLEKQISQLKAVCQRYLDQVKESTDKAVNPIKITRSVGLQVAFGDSSPYVNFEPIPTTSRNQEKLKKLLSAPPVNSRRSLATPDIHQNVTRSNSASPLPSNANSRNHEPRLVNGNSRISSPLSHCGSPTPNSSPSAAGSSRNTMKVTKPAAAADEDAPVIDLTDKDDKNENEGNVAAKNLLATVNGSAMVTYVPVKVNGQDQNRQPAQHPAPVPPPPPMAMVTGAKPVPPRPILKIDRGEAGIMLSWEFPRNTICAEIAKYQLFAYQETDLPPRPDLWKVVGDVTALPLPMACTLTQFIVGFKYHFTVRAVDVHNRCGPFSVPRTITL